MKTNDLRVALFSGNYNYVRDGANQALNRLVGYLLRQGVQVRVYSPTVAEPGSLFHYDLITVLWSFAQVGSGLCYVASFVMGIGMTPIQQAAASPTFEYGNTFMFLAGLLNYLVVHDAFDIAAGRKR